MTNHCRTLWTAMTRLREREQRVSDALKNAEQAAFDLGSLRSEMKELSAERERYQQLLKEQVNLGDGRMIQLQDYLAVRRMVEGCKSTEHSPGEIWTELLGWNGVASRLKLDDEGRLSRLNLSELFLSRVCVPATLTGLTELWAITNQLTQLVIPETLTSLTLLRASDNQLARLEIPDTLTNLKDLWAPGNQLTQLVIPTTLTRLEVLRADNNRLSQLTIPDTLTNLMQLSAGRNPLSQIALPGTLTSLQMLWIENNQLTQIVIPGTLKSLTQLYVGNNPDLVTLTIPENLSPQIVLISNCPQLSDATQKEARRRSWTL